MKLNVIILAAGKGTRMKSSMPKVLQPLAGIPLLEHVIQTAQILHPENIFVVVGYESEQIKNYFKNYKINWVSQEKQLGTAHAVQQVLPHLKNPDEKVLILYGDVPLISSEILKKLINSDSELAMLTANLKNPEGFGRIIRNQKNKIIKIIEQKDLSAEQQAIKEINPGIYFTSVKYLQAILPTISNTNAQQEYYLTDIISDKIDIVDSLVENNYEIMGVNDLQQLYILEKYYQKQLAKQFRLSGVMVSRDVIFEGHVEIERGSKIGPNCLIKNTKIGQNVEIKANCVIEDSMISDNCTVGPFARIRPETYLDQSVTIGNFVEIKKSRIGSKSKIPHLSYVGDTTMGESVNFGAGSITCNYDGSNKHQTVIGNNVFVGSDSQLVAPVNIHEGSTIGAGSTITKDTPSHKLTLSRVKQQTIENWKRPKKEE